MDLYERILTKEEINKRFIMAVTAIMMNKLISSKTGLAESLGVKPAKFSEILNGRMNVGIDMIARMCDFYGVSTDWLLLSRGNNVFRRMDKQAIWIDDENLNMECAEDEITDNKIVIDATSNATPISPTEESIIYKMYQDQLKAAQGEKEENKALIEEIGGLKERIRTLESKLQEYEPSPELPKGKIKGLGSSETAKPAHTKKHIPGSEHTFDPINLQTENP